MPLTYHNLKDIDNRYVSCRFWERKISWIYKPVLFFLRDKNMMFNNFLKFAQNGESLNSEENFIKKYLKIQENKFILPSVADGF